MKISQVLNCSFSSWYPKFKDHTIKSCILPLPPEFVNYLLQDQVVLPEGTLAAGTSENVSDDNRDQENAIDWATEDLLTPVAEAPSFPEFETMLKNRIKRLGCKVFPKLNWSAPRDATWISFDKTLKCTCPSDIYLLLKSSDFIAHDLTQPFVHCEDDENLKNDCKVMYELVLRKWQEFNPAYEFRCFVKNNQVVGISQRHNDMCYPFIVEHKAEIVADIQSFFYHVIKDNFPDTTYVFDVYRRNQGKLILLDFNPFGEVTDGLLFTWEELDTIDKPVPSQAGEPAQQTNEGEQEQLAEGEPIQQAQEGEPEQPTELPVFRCVQDSSGVQPSPYGMYAVPKDFVDLASGADPYKLMDFLRLREQQQNEESSSDEDTADNALDT